MVVILVSGIFLGLIASFTIPVFEVTQEIVIKLEKKNIKSKFTIYSYLFALKCYIQVKKWRKAA